MKWVLLSFVVVLFVLASATVLFFRAISYEDYQRAYRSGPLVYWVNNYLLVGDNGKTNVPVVNHVCTADELLGHDKNAPLPSCYVVGTTVPLHKCSFWWVAGDCVGLYASRDVLENPLLREAIIGAVRKGCTDNDFQSIDLSYLCSPGGKLRQKVLLKSVRKNDLTPLEYIIR